MLKVQGFSPGVLCPLLVDCCKGLPLCAVDVNLLRWWCKSEISIGVIPSVCDAGWLMSLWRYLKHLIICKFLCHFYMKWIKVYVLKTFVFTWIIINSKTNSFVTGNQLSVKAKRWLSPTLMQRAGRWIQPSMWKMWAAVLMFFTRGHTSPAVWDLCCWMLLSDSHTCL